MNKQLIFLYLVSFSFVFSQKLHWPTSTSKSFSSNFGEYRDGRFHMGIDIKTNAAIGKEIFAVEDGYIHRMRSEFTGYGKSLYQTTISGHEVVYAHLESFTPLMEKVWRLQQTKRMSYIVDAHFSSREFQVKKGDVIGFSGNTGNSFAPHLHFEYRSSKSEPLNPLTMGFTDLPDNVIPIPKELAIIPASKNTIINASLLTQIIPLFRDKTGTYHFADTISVFGKFAFALKAVDKREGANNIYQFHKVELRVNNKVEFGLEYSKIPFSQSKFAKTIIEYDLKRKNLGEFQKLYRLEEHKKTTLHNTDKNGILTLPPGIHSVEIIIYDAAGNKANVKGKVIGTFPMQLEAQEIYQDNKLTTLSLSPARGGLPIKEAVLYSFTPFGFVDQKINIISKTQVKNNLHVTFPSKLTSNRIIQILGINQLGGMIQPSHWTKLEPSIKVIDIYPDLKISNTEHGLLFQVDIDQYAKTNVSLKLANENTFNSYKMNQIRPTTFISDKLDHDVVNNMTHIVVELFHNENVKETRFHFQLKTIAPGEEEIIFSNDRNCKIKTKPGSFYQKNTIWVDKVEKFAPIKDGYHVSPVYQLQPYDLALKGKIEVELLYNRDLSEHSNLGIYYYDNKKEDWIYLPTERIRNKLTLKANLKEMEAITIIQDLDSPKITRFFPENGGRYQSRDVRQIRINIDDALSGIEPVEKSFSLKFNDEQLYPAYQPIQNLISYSFDKALSNGQHKLEFKVQDRLENEINKTVYFVILRE